MTINLAVEARTATGNVRPHNEDAVLVREVRTAAGSFQLWAVADGMGGHARGEVASRNALDALLSFVAYGAWTDPAEALREAYRVANDRVHRAGDGRGTTLVCALIEKASGRYWLGNVGDSRAYVLDSHGLRRMTVDHSAVQARVEAGLMSQDEAEHASGKNVLTRAIGPVEAVVADVTGPFVLHPGERLLLCSDGLHGMIDDNAIGATLAGTRLVDLPGALIAAANEAGGRDNISVVVGGIAADGERTLVPLAPMRRPGPTLWLMAAAAVAVVIFSAIAVAFAFGGGGGRDEKAKAAGASATAQAGGSGQGDENGAGAGSTAAGRDLRVTPTPTVTKASPSGSTSGGSIPNVNARNGTPTATPDLAPPVASASPLTTPAPATSAAASPSPSPPTPTPVPVPSAPTRLRFEVNGTYATLHWDYAGTVRVDSFEIRAGTQNAFAGPDDRQATFNQISCLTATVTAIKGTQRISSTTDCPPTQPPATPPVKPTCGGTGQPACPPPPVEPTCGGTGQPACPPPPVEPTCGGTGQPACPPPPVEPTCGGTGQPACPPPPVEPTCGGTGQPTCPVADGE